MANGAKDVLPDLVLFAIREMLGIEPVFNVVNDPNEMASVNVSNADDVVEIVVSSIDDLDVQELFQNATCAVLVMPVTLVVVDENVKIEHCKAVSTTDYNEHELQNSNEMVYAFNVVSNSTFKTNVEVHDVVDHDAELVLPFFMGVTILVRFPTSIHAINQIELPP